ncbi:BsuPI-related putative proteinase inhibitor [uncultured Paludibaculum sp.]|uniref:BsuPI-related putative proteinase inhibitor n=1 Tax=uncultured Paludibaculum sp. TaxID=1765020 RepID=UPI002AABEEB6|nr:BsuPI-related putative proteinase inhibitor [uncultured Paludibaculum sp.]
MRTTTALFAVLLCPSLFAQDYLPLGDGNYWTYQSDRSAATFTISAGTPFVINDQVYYSLKGYGTAKALVRRTAEGNLVQIDMETGVESPVTIFEPGKPWTSPLSGCQQTAETSAKRGEFANPAGLFTSALKVNYEPGGCSDAGFTEETYIENIGLVRRVVNTLAGPVQYDLVAARVGQFTFHAGPSIVTTVSVPENVLQRKTAAEAFHLEAILHIETISAMGVDVTFPTSQRCDMVLRNSTGEIVYRWSDGKVFTEVVAKESVGGRRSFAMDGVIDAATSAGLQDGIYTLEAWLTTGDGPKFASSAAMELYTRQTN